MLLLEQPGADSGASVEAGTSVGADGAFSCIVKSQKRRSNKIYKTKLTKIR